MAFETVQDLLQVIRESHDKIAQFYEDLSILTERGRVEMLLAYLSRHERQLSAGIAAFQQQADPATLATWFSLHSDFSIDAKLSESMLRPGFGLTDVVNLAITLDEYIITLFDTLALNAPNPKVREVFRNLLEQEKQEEHLVVQMAADLQRLV